MRPSKAQSVKADVVTDDEVNSGLDFIEQQSCDGDRFASSTHQTRLRAHNNGGERFNSVSPKRHIDKGEVQERPELVTPRVSHPANNRRKPTRQREEHGGSRNFVGSHSNGTYEGRRSEDGRRVGKASVRMRPDQPMRKKIVSPDGNRRVDWPKTGGRINLTPGAELDVMTGLVLAQQQRIERQRSKMLELERDLRYREPTTKPL